MNYYSQKNPAWKNQKLGTCGDTIGQSGCKITCYAMLISEDIENPNGGISDSNPSIIDWIATEERLYSSGCLTSDGIFAERFGIEYEGKSNTAPDYPCIAETNHYAYLGIKQHFYIIYPDGQIVDPLDISPYKRDNKYNVVSYRLMKPKGYEVSDWEDKYNDLKEEMQYVINNN